MLFYFDIVLRMLHDLVFNTNVLLSRGNNNTPTKALEQVRAALQPSLNVEIERVLHRYQEV